MSRIAAFFDMDRTVVSVNTGPLYLKHAFLHGRMSKTHLAIGLWYAILYKLTILDTESAMEEAIATMKGDDEKELTAFCQNWFDEDILPKISDTARKRIDMHRESGDLIVLLTASSSYSADPLGEHLKMDHVLSTRLEVKNGVLTGHPLLPLCIGQGKVYWAQKFAEENDIDLSTSFFYTDSINDMPMLLKVGHPIIVNPDFRLARSAKKNGWLTEHWK